VTQLNVAIIIVVGLGMLGVLFVPLWRRRARDRSVVGLAPIGSVSPAERSSMLPVSEDGVALETVLVRMPHAYDAFLTIGDVSGLQLVGQPTPFLGSGAPVRELARHLSTAFNVPAQAAQGLQQGANLVRLAPESMRFVEEGHVFVRVAGKPGGMLRGPGGQFSHMVRLEPVGATVSVVASAGMALTMASMQMQLNEVSQRLNVILSKVERVQQGNEDERMGRLESLVRAIDYSYLQALAAGEVTDAMVREISGKGQDLDGEVRRIQKTLNRRLASRPTHGTAESWAKWLDDDGLPAIEEIEQLVVAGHGLLMQRWLYTANLAHSGLTTDNLAQREALRQTAALREELSELVSRLTYDIGRALHLAAVVPGRLSRPEWVKRRAVPGLSTSDRVSQTAEALQELVADAGIPVPAVPPLPAVPALGKDDAESDAPWRGLLRYFLHKDELLLTYVFGRGVSHRDINVQASPSVIVITDQRVIGLQQKPFSKHGRVAVEAIRRNVGLTRVHMRGKTLVIDVADQRVSLHLAGVSVKEAYHIEQRVREIMACSSSNGSRTERQAAPELTSTHPALTSA
jgi:hypothetical protein